MRWINRAIVALLAAERVFFGASNLGKESRDSQLNGSVAQTLYSAGRKNFSLSVDYSAGFRVAGSANAGPLDSDPLPS